MMTLAGARAEGACAAYRRAAVVTVHRRHPSQRRWRYGLVFLASIPAGVAMFVIVPLTLLMVGVLAAELGWPAGVAVGSVAAVVSFVGIAALVLASAAPGLGAVAPRDRALARAWAEQAGVVLWEASTLVVAPDQPRAATILVRRLLAFADRDGISVIARPRTPAVAAMYEAVHFAALPGATGRILLRPAQPGRHRGR